MDTVCFLHHSTPHHNLNRRMTDIECCMSWLHMQLLKRAGLASLQSLVCPHRHRRLSSAPISSALIVMCSKCLLLAQSCWLCMCVTCDLVAISVTLLLMTLSVQCVRHVRCVVNWVREYALARIRDNRNWYVITKYFAFIPLSGALLLNDAGMCR